jgi:hypothetical protein
MLLDWKRIAVGVIFPTRVQVSMVNADLAAMFGRLLSAARKLPVAWAAVLCVTSPLLAQNALDVSTDPPRLSTGSLELQWIDKHYPETGDQEQRRRSLEAALRYFPEDPATGFRIGVRLAIIDRNMGRPRAGHERLDRLLRVSSPKVDRDIFSWAEIVDARILSDLHRVPEALALFERVAGDKDLSIARRAMAAADAGELMLERSPEDALALLQGVASLLGGDTPEVEASIMHALLMEGRDDDVQSELASFVAGQPADSVEARLAGLLGATPAWNLAGDGQRVAHLVELIGAVRQNPGSVLSAAMAKSRLVSSCQLIRVRFMKLIVSDPLENWYTVEPRNQSTSLAGIERLIGQALHQNDPRRCLSLSLLALTKPATNDDLSRMLWKACSYADWAERGTAGTFDKRVCGVLLDLCDQLPAGQTYWVEGKFLRAERLARSGDRRGEQTVLGDIFTVGGLSPAYLSAACKRLGLSLEATGEDQKAFETFKLAESTAASFSAGVDCLLHEVMIDLRLGNNDDALRLIGMLRETPSQVLRGSSAPEQIHDLDELVKTGQAAECWDSGRKWWSLWQQMEEEFTGRRDRPEERIPIIPNLSRYLDDTRHLAEDGDSKGYFNHYAVLVSAARWEPSIGPEVAALSAPAFRFAPGRTDQLRGMLTSILEGPHPAGIPNLRKRKLFLADNYLNSHSPDKVLHIAAGFDSPGSPPDDLDPVMHQIRALAALESGLEYSPAAADLEGDLAASKAGEQRAMAVGLLAELYVRLDRERDARQLLARELDNPAIVADSKGHADLAGRLDRLSGEKGAGGVAGAGTVSPSRLDGTRSRPATAIDGSEGWARSFPMNWYDYVEPESLEDPRLKNLDDVLKDPGNAFPAAGQIKVLLLAARDGRLPPEQRHEALADAAIRLVLSAPTYSRMDAIVRSALSHPAFDDESRMRVLWTLLAALCEDGRRADYDSWRKNPVCGHFSPDLQSQLELLDLEAHLDRTLPGPVMTLAASLGFRELYWPGLQTEKDLFGYLLRMGAISEAETLAARVPSWKLAAVAEPHRAATELDFARRLRIARGLNPMHDAMAASLLASHPVVPGVLPSEFRDARISVEFPSRLPKATLQACLYLAATHQFDREDLGFWGTVIGALSNNKGSEDGVGNLLRAGLATAPDDQARSELIVRFVSSADIDNPSIRILAEREFAAYRRPNDFPHSYLVIRLYEVHLAMRLGEPVALETAYSDLNDPRVNVVRARDSLRLYTQTGDLDSLKRTLDGIDSGTLLSAGFAAQALPAFAQLGMSAELKSAQEAVRLMVRDDVSASWVTGKASLAEAALDLALALGDPKALPVEWVRDFSGDPSDPLLEQRVALVNAYLQADWQGVEKAASALNADFPNRYSFYWYRGLALHNLGRDGEASAPLETYVHRAKDELEYPLALALLKSINAEELGSKVSAK